MWKLQLSEGLALLVGLALLPGVIAVLIRDALAETKERDIQHLLVAAAVFDVAIFAALLIFKPLGLTPYPDGGSFNPLTALAAGMLAVVFGALTGSTQIRRTLQGLLFRFGWTKKGVTNTWVDAFQHAEAAGAWAYVHLKDGRRVFGMPKYYSASASEPCLYLVRGPIGDEPVTIHAARGDQPVPQAGPGVLITPAAEITLVAFLDGQSAD